MATGITVELNGLALTAEQVDKLAAEVKQKREKLTPRPKPGDVVQFLASETPSSRYRVVDTGKAAYLLQWVLDYRDAALLIDLYHGTLTWHFTLATATVAT